LDPTFGTNGFASINFPGSTKDAGNAISVTQPDGKILLAGQEFDSNENIEVARLNPEGNLDTTFGNGGHVLLHYGTLCRADSIAVQPDGKILVGGAFNGQPGKQSPGGFPIDGYAGVVRLNPNGTLDTKFGAGGLAVSNQVFLGDSLVPHLVLQPNGSIVVAGAVDREYLDFALTRFTGNGQVDTTFGTAGVSTVDFGFIDPVGDLTTDNSGNLIVAGGITPLGNLGERNLGVARLTPDGVLDPIFGTGGKTIVTPAAPYSQIGVQAVVVDADNRILLGGATFSDTTGNGYDFSIVALDSAGALDLSFGSGGRVTSEIAGGSDFIAALALQSDGKIVAAGQAFGTFAVARYNTDGSPDTSFNSTGIYAKDQPNYTDFANGAFGVGASQFGPVVAVTVQPDGDIDAIGTWNPGGLPYVYVARLTDQPTTIDFSNGFADNGELTLNGAASLDGSALSLSGGGPASAFSTLPRDVTEFNTQFTFNGGAAPGGNFSFILQSNANTALTGGLDRSFAVNFDLSSSTIQTSLIINGDRTLPGNSSFAYSNTHTYGVTLNYILFNAGATLRGKLTDLSTGALSSVFENNWSQIIDVPTFVKGGAAFVGFTSGGAAPSILSWSFTAPKIGGTPFAPSFLERKTSQNQITLTWTDNSDNEDGFDIEKSEDGVNFEHLDYVPANTTTYTDTIAPADFGRSLVYRVRAFNSAGWSIGTTTADVHTIIVGAAPTNANAVAVPPNEVDLSWQDNTGLHSAYRIYRRTGGTGDFSLYALVHQGLSSYVDNQAPSGTLLEYRIAAFAGVPNPNVSAEEGESAPAFASATTPAAPADHFGPQLITNGSAHLAGGSLVLTDDQPTAETGSAWAKDFQYTTEFMTQFSFRFANADPGGMTFETQDPNPAVADGHNALGDNADFGFGGALGSQHPLGLKFYLGGAGGSGGGATGNIGDSYFDSINVTSAGINFGSGHFFDVTLAYSRLVMTETITDASTSATFTHRYWMRLGDAFELVGVSGSKPATSAQAISISSWTLSSPSGPSPATLISASRRATDLTLSATAIVGGSATLTSTLLTSGTPISGATISFTSSDGTRLGTAVTDANGVATLYNVSIGSLGAGTYANALAASFAGDSDNLPSDTSGTLTIIDENLQGMVWADFNNDGNVDFGEQGIGGVPITLFGSNGNVVATTTTDSNGLYTFNHVPPDVYSISEGGAGAGYVEGKDSLGTITDSQGNLIRSGAGNASVQDLFSNVPVGADQNAINYNFGEQPAAGSAVSKGQAATMGFWQNKNGQALIGKFTSISSWLATTMPQTFGYLADFNGPSQPATAQQVASLYQQRFVLTDKLDAQVMATALNVYATNQSLGGVAAAYYGFAVSQYGLGDSTWNVGSDGAAFNVGNNSVLTVMQILQDWDQQTSKSTKSIRQLALDSFGGINAKGGI
ncbi:MAG TPA: SdrD B-like domain-containing protein, partial [Tepidisphaeraceae bacterium]|nr:SdrD B-like domain-containing protein [Tepidisphaeraceae bacterium]